MQIENFARAIALHRVGRDEEAMNIYCRVICTHPSNPGVRHNLGAILFERSDKLIALVWFKRSWLVGVTGISFWLDCNDEMNAQHRPVFAGTGIVSRYEELGP